MKELKLDMKNVGTRSVSTSFFDTILNSSKNIQLNTWGDFTGDAGDALQYNQQYNHNTQMFTTMDQDHDNYGL